jgi:hypothetical protein
MLSMRIFRLYDGDLYFQGEKKWSWKPASWFVLEWKERAK